MHSELFRLVNGPVRPDAGRVLRDGVVLPPGDPRAAIAAGLGLCPEDRKDAGLIPLASVRENTAMAWRNLRGGTPWLRRRAERDGAAAVIADMRVKTASAETPIAQLSGGNQQKAVIGRWLMAEARVLLLDEPTRGIDVGARSENYDRLYRFAEAGGSVLFASADMAEVLGVADRIAVMREGTLAAVIPREQANAETLLRLALPESTTSSVREPMPA